MVRRAVPYALLALLTVGVVATFVAVEPGNGFVRSARTQWQYAAEARIAAQRLESGATEFALQQRQRDGWGELQLPNPRFLSPSSPVDAWRHSGALQLDNGVEVRIAAQRRTNSQIEFALQIRTDGRWSQRVLPLNRIFPVAPPLETWLFSSSLRAPQATHAPLAYVNACSIGRAIVCRTFEHSDGRVTTRLRVTPSQSGLRDVRLEISCNRGGDLTFELLNLPFVELEKSTPVRMRLDTGAVDAEEWSVWVSRDRQTMTVRSPRTAVPDQVGFLYDGQVVEIELQDADLPIYRFEIAGLFITPLQDNISHCGNYTDEAPRPVPPPYSASGYTHLPGSNAGSNSWWRESGPRRLSRVFLSQTVPIRWELDEEDSSDQRMWFRLICGPYGLEGGASMGPSVELRLWPDLPYPADEVRVQWAIDGGAVRDEIWTDSWSGYRPSDLRTFLSAALRGSVLQLTIGDELQLSASLKLDVMFNTPLQNLLEECLSHPTSPDVSRSGSFAGSQPGISYRWGTHVLGRWDGWVSVEVDSLAVQREESSQATPALVLTCGIDGLGVVVYGLEHSAPFNTSRTAVEVTWTADRTTSTEIWDLWTAEASPLGRAISPRNDDDFYEAIRSADRLTVSSASNPRITDSFDLVGLGVWELPVIDGLDGCADAPREH